MNQSPYGSLPRYSGSPHAPRQIALDPYAQGQRVPTHIPGIERAIPAEAMHVIANQAPDQWLTLNTGAMAPGAPAQEFNVQWRTPGEVIGLFLHSDVGSPQSLCALGLKMAIGPEQMQMSLNANSGTADFTRFAGINGLSLNYVAPLYQPVCQNDKWLVSVQNFDATNTYTGFVTFHFRRCR